MASKITNSVRLPDKLYGPLKILRDSTRVPIQARVEEAIEAYLARPEIKQLLSAAKKRGG